MAYKDTMMIRDDEMFAALQHCRRIGAFARVHAENGDVIKEVRFHCCFKQYLF
jgi:dihydropyrimidinase-like 5